MGSKAKNNKYDMLSIMQTLCFQNVYQKWLRYKNKNKKEDKGWN